MFYSIETICSPTLAPQDNQSIQKSTTCPFAVRAQGHESHHPDKTMPIACAGERCSAFCPVSLHLESGIIGLLIGDVNLTG